jgi:hypothetical protein
MKILSRWASRHVTLAICLIIVCEVVNAFTGILLGANLLANWPLSHLLCLAFGLVGGAIWVRMEPASATSLSFSASRWWITGAFLGNFLLFGVLGGLLNESVRNPTLNTAAMGLRRVVSSSDTLVKPETSRSNQRDYYAERSLRERSPGGIRVGYIFLFLIGLVLSVLAAFVACNLACSGYGVLAALVMLLGVGAQGTGFFFLSRALEKVLAPWREMEYRDRRRVTRRFLLILLGFWLLLIARLAIE